MIKYRALAWCLVVGAALGARPRMANEERDQIFNDLRARHRSANRKVACIPPEHPSDNTHPMPVAPHSFTTKVEIAFQEENKYKVINGAESFDGVLNTGILKYEIAEGIIFDRPDDIEEIIRYSIPLDEALFIRTNEVCEDEGLENCERKKHCRAGKLNDLSAELQELFGYGDVNGAGGYFGAGGILQWGPQYNYEYRGMAPCRGMMCEKYETCVTKPDLKETASITYYWSSPEWNVSANGMQVPVAIELYATEKFDIIFTREVLQRYDFYDFYRDVRPDPDELQPPADVSCKNRHNVYDPPHVPAFFRYEYETVAAFDMAFPVNENETTSVQFSSVMTHTQYYDWDAKVVSTKFTPLFIFGEQNRYEYTTTVIQDFQQGLQYDIQERLGSCNVRRIENRTSGGDVIVGDDGSVTMMPPWIFEDLDEPMQYNGAHWTRGMEADVWVGLKRHLLLEETYVWYYASPLMLDESEAYTSGLHYSDVAANNGVDPPQEIISTDHNPVRFEKYLNVLANYPHLLHNIFKYQDDPPMTHVLDISPCYDPTSQMRHFIIDLPSDTLTRVNSLRDRFLYSAQQALAEVAVVAPVRINRLVLEEGDNKLRILFTILDTSLVEGDGEGAGLENDMDGAANRIRDYLDASKLVIIVRIPVIARREEPVYVAVVPVAGTMREVDRDITNSYTYETMQQYQSGDMAGLAVGMLILGALVGVAAQMVVARGKSGLTSIPRVSLARSKPNPENTINLNADLTGTEI